MSDLKEKRCMACEGGIAALTAEQSKALNAQVREWKIVNHHKTISRTFQFHNYYQTMAFVNAVAWVANQENHHPDLEVSYKTCKVNYTTHAVEGLTENDFICAAKIDELIRHGE